MGLLVMHATQTPLRRKWRGVPQTAALVSGWPIVDCSGTPRGIKLCYYRYRGTVRGYWSLGH